MQIITIGCDPEFICVKNKRPINNNYFLYNEDNNTQEFGIDGSLSTTLEVRPQPSLEPLEVISNIHKIFKKIHNKQPFVNSNWIAGSYKYRNSLGGHIHFGISKYNLNTNNLIQTLDEYLGLITVLIEDKKEGIKRRYNYGSRGDYRSQPYGIEYRVPGSWLSCPYVSSSILCLAKVIVNEYLNKNKNNLRHFYINDQIDDPFLINNRKDLLKQFVEIWSDIKKMTLYPKYKPHIDLLYFIIKNNHIWFPTIGMKKAWGLFNIDNISLRTIWRHYQ